MKRLFCRVIFLLNIITLTLPALAFPSSTHFPDSLWFRYDNVSDAGFSEEQLALVKLYYDSLDAAAFMVIYDGAVVVDWGETARRFRCHSARKSLMSGMYGIFIDKGIIDTTKSLAELGIDDSTHPLTEIEKTATIENLLCARSGIYLLAAYEPAQNPKPERGAFPPGTHWCYNNWDFNTLLTILEQEAGISFFEEFDRRFAQPLGMQDYHSSVGYYHYEREKSSHPAYPFRLSARDMARYGLLYLNDGQWRDKQILSKSFVDKSHARISTDSWTGSYGYMWWVYDEEPYKSFGLYSALGLGEQSIDILLNENMVMVIRTNTYNGSQVSQEERLKLMRMIVAARIGNPSPNPTLSPIPDPPPSYSPLPMTTEEMNQYVGEYRLADNEPPLKILIDNGQLQLEETEGAIPLYKIGDDHFLLDDFNEHIYFENESDTHKQIILADIFNYRAYTELQNGHFDKAADIIDSALRYFPGDIRILDMKTTVAVNQMDQLFQETMANIQAAAAQRKKTNPRYSPLAWVVLGNYGTLYPQHLSTDQMSRYVGNYGERNIAIEDSSLVYWRNDSNEKRKLSPITDMIFAVEGLDYFRICFDLDAENNITQLVGWYFDGRTSVSPKDNYPAQ